MTSESHIEPQFVIQGASSDEPSLDSKVRALSSPAIYGASARIDIIETHFAWIFLTEQHAYKLKKPMRADRMDHRTLQARHRSCLEELRLNRRLAPNVYLDVMALKFTKNDGFSFDGAGGEVVDWLVKMKRLPAHAMLDRAIAANSVTRSAIHAVGRMLANFYARLTPVAISELDYLQRVRNQIHADHAELSAPDLRLPTELVDSIIHRQSQFTEEHATDIGQRALNKRFLETHGDLRPEHVFLGTPPCVIDCLEFDRDLRLCDPLEELAFFFVECGRLGAEWIGREVVRIYCDHTDDALNPKLFCFYVSRRAAHRAIIAAWHLRDATVRDKADWSAVAVGYLRVAHRYACESDGARCFNRK